MTTRRGIRATLAIALTAALAACGVTATGPGGADPVRRPSVASTTTATSPPDPTTTTAPRPTTTSTTSTTAAPPTTAAPTLTPEQERGVAATTKLYEGYGLSADKARCLAVNVITKFGTLDNRTMLDLVSSCGLTQSDLLAMTRELGGSTPTDVFRNSMVRSLEAEGMSTGKATCMADAYIAKYGTDIAKLQEATAVQGLLRECGIDRGDFDLGG